MKKITLLMIIVLLLFNVFLPWLFNIDICYAEDSLVLSYAATDYDLYSKGIFIKTDSCLYNVEGTICASLRTISESMDVSASWDSNTYTANFSNDKHTLSMQLHNYTVTYDGSSISVGTPLYQIDGRLFVPIQFLTECFDYKYFLYEQDKKCVLEQKSYTKTTISESGRIFTVSPLNIENGDLIVLALYKDKRFLKMYNVKYQGKDVEFDTDENYDIAKVMVWDNLNTLKLITDVEDVKWVEVTKNAKYAYVLDKVYLKNGNSISFSDEYSDTAYLVVPDKEVKIDFENEEDDEEECDEDDKKADTGTYYVFLTTEACNDK